MTVRNQNMDGSIQVYVGFVSCVFPVNPWNEISLMSHWEILSDIERYWEILRDSCEWLRKSHAGVFRFIGAS